MPPGDYSYPPDLDWRSLLAVFRCAELGARGRCQLFVNHDGPCAFAWLGVDEHRRTRRGHPLDTAARVLRWDAHGAWTEDLDEWRGASRERLPWCCMFAA